MAKVFEISKDDEVVATVEGPGEASKKVEELSGVKRKGRQNLTPIFAKMEAGDESYAGNGIRVKRVDPEEEPEIPEEDDEPSEDGEPKENQ